MTEPDPQSQPPKRPLGRRRRANVERGRRVAYQVKLTEEEQTRLAALAEEQEVTIQRLLVESALAGVGETPARRRQAMVELFAIRRVLATNANNLNQIARLANISGDVPAGLDVVLLELRGLVGRIDGAIDGLAGG
ncbi:MAG: plasmid mobilization relaxosome protein MobC [Solirubrobacteraceae bacterium]